MDTSLCTPSEPIFARFFFHVKRRDDEREELYQNVTFKIRYHDQVSNDNPTLDYVNRRHQPASLLLDSSTSESPPRHPFERQSSIGRRDVKYGLVKSMLGSPTMMLMISKKMYMFKGRGEDGLNDVLSADE